MKRYSGENGKDPIITFEQAKNMNTINIDGLAKDFSKHSFWHYTKVQSLAKIFDENETDYTLLCNRLDNMNDLAERKRLNAQNVFVICFCNTDSEKIPMWYLYASLTGNGVAIGLTPLKMLEFLKSLKYVYGNRKENGEIKKRERISLEQLEIKCGWVYYVKYERNKTKFYYNEHFYEISDFDRSCNDFYFLKAYPWNYEKEFRIVVTDKEKRNFDSLSLPIPKEIAKQMKLKKEKKSKITQYSFPMSQSKIRESELDIKMDLLERHKDEVIDYIKSKLNK